MDFNPKTNKLISASFDETVCLWDINKPKSPIFQLNSDNYHNAIYTTKFHPTDSNLVYSSGTASDKGVNCISCLDIRQEGFVKKLTHKELDPKRHFYQKFEMIDGKYVLFTCNFDGKVKQFSLDTKKNTLDLNKV